MRMRPLPVRLNRCPVQVRAKCRWVRAKCQVECRWIGCEGAGCRVQGAGCRVHGAWCRVQGIWCRVQGTGYRVQGACQTAPTRSTRVRVHIRRLCPLHHERLSLEPHAQVLCPLHHELGTLHLHHVPNMAGALSVASRAGVGRHAAHRTRLWWHRRSCGSERRRRVCEV